MIRTAFCPDVFVKIWSKMFGLFRHLADERRLSAVILNTVPEYHQDIFFKRLATYSQGKYLYVKWMLVSRASYFQIPVNSIQFHRKIEPTWHKKSKKRFWAHLSLHFSSASFQLVYNISFTKRLCINHHCQLTFQWLFFVWIQGSFTGFKELRQILLKTGVKLIKKSLLSLFFSKVSENTT